MRDALSRGYDVLGFDQAAGGDEVFRQLALARIIEPVSKLDSLRVLEEIGVGAPSCRTVLRRLEAERRRLGDAVFCRQFGALGRFAR